MKALFENSLFVRLLMCLRAWYHEGAIAGFFNRIRQAYPSSVFCRLWNKFCAAPICTSANSIYARILAALRRFVEKLGGIAANSLIYRICLAVWRPIERVAGGGLIGRACRFVGMRVHPVAHGDEACAARLACYAGGCLSAAVHRGRLFPDVCGFAEYAYRGSRLPCGCGVPVLVLPRHPPD